MKIQRRILASMVSVALFAGILVVPLSGSASAGTQTTLTIANSEWLYTCGFSPFNPIDQFLDVGTVYEPLMFVNEMNNGAITPWLATAYAWSNGNKTLTFTIRSGVKWNDGQPFTAADVAFTFNMLKKNPALDLNSVWSVLQSVTQSGANKVVMNFKTEAIPYFYYIADQIGIVPEHIWSKVKNPVTFKDTNPVGTGAYEVSSCTSENVSYVKNPNYWQPGLPKIDKIEYPAYTSNTPADVLLSTGGAQWGGQGMANIKAEWLDKSATNKVWLAPAQNVAIFINQTDPLLSNVAVREAMVYGIDKSKVDAIGEHNQEDVGNQAGIVTPTFSSWLDKPQLAKAGYTYDPAKAISILKAAGFKMVNGVFQSKSGQKLSFSLLNEGGYSDWVAATQVITTELAAVGIDITVDNESGGDYSSSLYYGKFQLAYAYEAGGPTPYYELSQMLSSAKSAPIGKAATTNWERFNNPTANKLIAEYNSASTSAEQHSIMDQLQDIVLKDVPVIPVTEQSDWDEYSTAEYTGWPTASDPYAQGYANVFPDWGIVLLHLKVK
jgi:peptide/nickel transport system substrate-binding protein